MSFGRLQSARKAAPMSDINMTPLIDVMLVLLIIFMVAAPLMSAALHLDLPPSGAAATPNAGPPPQQLALDAQGRLYWNGEAQTREQAQARLQQLGREHPDTELQLAVDQAVPYGRLAALLDQLQAAQLTRIAFATAPAAAGAAASAQ